MGGARPDRSAGTYRGICLLGRNRLCLRPEWWQTPFAPDEARVMRQAAIGSGRRLPFAQEFILPQPDQLIRPPSRKAPYRCGAIGSGCSRLMCKTSHRPQSPDRIIHFPWCKDALNTMHRRVIGRIFCPKPCSDHFARRRVRSRCNHSAVMISGAVRISPDATSSINLSNVTRWPRISSASPSTPKTPAQSSGRSVSAT